MKRRSFLIGMLAAPIAPAMPVPRWPTPAPYDGVAEAACNALADAIFRTVNPPLVATPLGYETLTVRPMTQEDSAAMQAWWSKVRVTETTLTSNPGPAWLRSE